MPVLNAQALDTDPAGVRKLRATLETDPAYCAKTARPGDVPDHRAVPAPEVQELPPVQPPVAELA